MHFELLLLNKTVHAAAQDFFSPEKRLFCLTTEDSQDSITIEQRASCLCGAKMNNLVAP
jgi:hypothetical protein